MKFTAIAPKMTIQPRTIKAAYNHKRQASRIKELYPSKWQVAVTLGLIVVTAIVWSIA